MNTTTAPSNILSRVQALIAKAEATDFPEEAEAFMAKAQELMARHAIDIAMLGGNKDRSKIVTRDILVQAPYGTAKVALINAIALANDVRVVYSDLSGGNKSVTMVGYPADLDTVETLYTSLSMQAARALRQADVFGSVRSFRHSFMLSYAYRIGARLAEARKAAAEEYETETGTSTALVLVSKKAEVDDVFTEHFPRTRTSRTTSSNGAGHREGARAANSASLGQRGVAGGNRALGR